MNIREVVTRPLVAALIVASVLAAVYVAVRPLLGSDPEPVAQGVVAAQSDPDDGPSDDVDPAEEVDEALPAVVYEVFLSRDPFEPVREPAAATDETVETVTTAGSPDEDAAGTTDGDAAETTASGDAPTLDETASEGEPAAGGGDAPACSGDDEVVCEGAAVSLVEVSEHDGREVAVVQVDTYVYEVAEGETFAGRLQVLSIDGDCASFLFGDERFELCEGDRALK